MSACCPKSFAENWAYPRGLMLADCLFACRSDSMSFDYSLGGRMMNLDTSGDSMPDTHKLIPAQELAATNKAHFPNESAEYRAARNALLVEEIDLRRQLERV